MYIYTYIYTWLTFISLLFVNFLILRPHTHPLILRPNTLPVPTTSSIFGQESWSERGVQRAALKLVGEDSRPRRQHGDVILLPSHVLNICNVEKTGIKRLFLVSTLGFEYCESLRGRISQVEVSSLFCEISSTLIQSVMSPL